MTPARTLGLLLLLLHAPLRAQQPGVVTGTVVDATTHLPVAGASVRLGDEPGVRTDAAGHFRLPAMDPGTRPLRVEGFGYAAREVSVDVRPGEEVRVDVRLDPQPVTLPGVVARAAASLTDGYRLERADLQRAGARTAADALKSLPGVVLHTTGPGGPQYLSIRGANESSVLVLVDGVPLNDPVTGQADLTRVSAASIASITVLPGARSAAWGGRASGGVVLIESRGAAGMDRELSLGGGTLGTADAALSWSGGTRTSWTLGAGGRRQSGAFDFDLPAQAGGGAARRANADVRALQAHGGVRGTLLGGALDVRGGHDVLRRGLPGRSYATSPAARQDVLDDRASASWRRATSDLALSLLLSGARERIRHHDAQPPFGQPYDDTTRVTALLVRATGERQWPHGRSLGLGSELRHEALRSTALAQNAPTSLLNAGFYLRGASALAGVRGLSLEAQLRTDRAALGGAWFFSHALTLAFARGGLALHVTQRSSFTPPTMADRFFRDAVGVEPDPDLRAERVPGEVEAGAQLIANARGWLLTLRTSAWRSDVHGMILWAPDYRFIWRPYNADAKRAGLELGGTLDSRDRRLRFTGAWTLARATYDRGAGDDGVQIAYRPRHTGSLSLAFRPAASELQADLRYTGERTTAPTPVNLLPGFFTLDGALAHTVPLGAWRARFELRVDRLLDEKASLIFGFPEPGRVLRLGVRLTPDFAAAASIAGVLQS